MYVVDLNIPSRKIPENNRLLARVRYPDEGYAYLDRYRSPPFIIAALSRERERSLIMYARARH